MPQQVHQAGAQRCVQLFLAVAGHSANRKSKGCGQLLQERVRYK
jgi:hypothetical protein